MKMSYAVTKALIAAALTLGFSAAAVADRDNGIHFGDELESCVEALKDRLDLSGVHRIVHVVTKSDAGALGYTLTLETSTYTDAVEKRYSTRCAAIGKNQPYRLRVKEQFD